VSTVDAGKPKVDVSGQVYYPSVVVNLRLRFDENLTVLPSKVATFTTPELLARADPASKPQGNPQIFAKSNGDLSFIRGRIPTKGSLELPAYREAGTFKLTFNYSDLPIDPRLVRSCAVEVFLNTVSARSFAQGMTQTNPKFERESIIRSNTRLSQLAPWSDRPILVGTVDTWNVDHGAKGSTVMLDGRDLRGIFLGSPVAPETLSKLPLRSNIEELVKFIISKHPAGGKVQVECAPDDQWPDGKKPVVGASAQTRVRKGAEGNDSKGSAGGDADKMNVWDLITRYCMLVGAVPYFSGQDLRIRPMRTLYDQLHITSEGKTDSPFESDRSAFGVKDVRQLVYGQNVETLTFERKFNGFKARTVEVWSLDTSSKARGTGKVLKASWPPEKKGKGVVGEDSALADVNSQESTVANVPPSGEASDSDVQRIVVRGISDKKRLLQIAQDIYEEIGRGEAGGSVHTNSLASYGAGSGANSDPDLLRIRPGDAVRIGIAQGSIGEVSSFISPLNVQSSLSDAALLQDMTNRLGDPQLAKAIVLSSRNYVAELQNVFRVSNVKYDWDIETGVKVAFDFANYVRARAEVTPIPKQSTAATTKKATPNTGE
jgi:hypothetical protein